MTPATDELRRRRRPPPAPVKQPAATTTTMAQSQSRPRDYTAIYAWHSEHPPPPPPLSAMKRSATFGCDESNPVRSDADGYVDLASHRNSVQPPSDRERRPSATTDRRHDGPHQFVARTNCSHCGDFVDMRGICRAVVTAADRLQIELFYRSNKTEVISCACAARLYFASARRHSSIPGSGGGAASATQPEVADAVRWYPTTAVGVPVIVLDCGGSRCRDRKLNIVLAEVGSGFALWRDTVDHLTGYRAVANDFHSLRFSHDHSRLAGLRFADPTAAETFGHQLHTITSGPAGDALLNLCVDRRSGKLGDADFQSSYFAFHRPISDTKSATKMPNLRPKLKKYDISGPCCFEHITKFESVPGFLV